MANTTWRRVPLGGSETIELNRSSGHILTEQVSPGCAKGDTGVGYRERGVVTTQRCKTTVR